jgi:hypothetical protein
MRPKATRFFALPVFGEGGVGHFPAGSLKRVGRNKRSALRRWQTQRRNKAIAPYDRGDIKNPTLPSPKTGRKSDG